ncbi:MAG: hypothetical protein ACYCZO_08080 [Daejeonella sp.]
MFLWEVKEVPNVDLALHKATGTTMTMELKQFAEIFDHASLIGLPAATFYLMRLVINRIYAFKLRTTPLKVSKKYLPDGSLQEVTMEFRA